MSKDKYFRELMKSKKDPARDEIWESIKDELNNTAVIVKNSSDTLAVSRNSVKHKRIVWIVCAVVLLLGIALGSYYVWKYFDEPKIRYCILGEYFIEDAPQTLGQYVTDNEEKILYIDWYNDIEYCYNQIYKLKTTQEVICLYEEVIDNRGNVCYLYAVDNHTELDVLQQFVQICTETVTRNGFDILYGVDSQISCVIVESDGYKYYIKVEENLEQDYILGLVDKLFENK